MAEFDNGPTDWKNRQRIYDRIEMRIGDTATPITLEKVTLREARQHMRKWLDKHKMEYGSMVAYVNHKAVCITGIRDSKHKHMPVATATIG
jgi:hypothetical protein